MKNRKDLSQLAYVAVRCMDISKKLTLDEVVFLARFENLLDQDCDVYDVWEMFSKCKTDDDALDVLGDVLPNTFN